MTDTATKEQTSTAGISPFAKKSLIYRHFQRFWQILVDVVQSCEGSAGSLSSLTPRHLAPLALAKTSATRISRRTHLRRSCRKAGILGIAVNRLSDAIVAKRFTTVRADSAAPLSETLHIGDRRESRTDLCADSLRPRTAHKTCARNFCRGEQARHQTSDRTGISW